ncbi:MAG: MAPEG family protein [Caulobacterales bacterium]
MSVELTMLAYAVALLFVLILIQAGSAARAQGGMVMAGPRDSLKPQTAWEARTKRIVDNHREGLILFAPLVLIAAVQNVSTPTTVLGAQLFFYARVAHALLYLFGVPYVRPLAWFVGIAGTVLVFLALFGLA